MPRGTAVAKVESSLKSEARKKGLRGRAADNLVYGVLNKTGLMHGNKPTLKGLKPPRPVKQSALKG